MHTSCTQVLDAFIEAARTANLPCVLLRPREFSETTAFDGDFDFLIDDSRFDEILAWVFHACRNAGVSFVVRQRAAFKRQIELLDADSRCITLELWTHAEFRTGRGHGHLTRAALSYQAYNAIAPGDRASALAALFILHLHHKQKDTRTALTQARLDHFLNQPGLAPALHDTLANIKTGTFDLEQAHACALAHLHAHRIAISSPWCVLARRTALALRGFLRWPAPGAIAVVGPDGSGKSALIQHIMQGPLAAAFRFRRFKRFFRRPLFHLRRSEPRNVRDEKMLWLVLPVAWGCFSVWCWLTSWSKPVIVDRYFYDYFAQNVRSDSVPMQRISAYSLCTALVPQPSQLIIASCPVDIIHQRKMEMTDVSIGLLYDTYLDQVVRGRVPETLFCHTGTSLDRSGSQMASFVAR